jgi:hypothetical protein
VNVFGFRERPRDRRLAVSSRGLESSAARAPRFRRVVVAAILDSIRFVASSGEVILPSRADAIEIDPLRPATSSSFDAFLGPRAPPVLLPSGLLDLVDANDD